jgi:hypothetical protein
MAYETADSLIAVLAAIPDEVEALVRRARERDGSALDAPSGAGNGDAWTPSEIAGHLSDSARYWGARMRRVVYEEGPLLEGVDEQTLVRIGAHRYVPIDQLLREFRIRSEGNVAFLRGLDASTWERAGTHVERGPMTLREIVAVETEHEQNHVRQMRATLKVE